MTTSLGEGGRETIDGIGDRHGAREDHPVARVALVIGLAMATYASLRPFAGWQHHGMSAFAYLRGPYTLSFSNHWDVFLNATGYFLLGMAAVLSLAPRLKGALAVAVASVALTAMSVSVEALQTFLPSRLASLTDVVTNVAGAITGGTVAAFLSRRLRAEAGLAALRRRMLVPGVAGDVGLLLVALWLTGLLAPRILLLGMGDFRFLTVDAFTLHEPVVYKTAEAVVAAINVVALALLVRTVAAHGMSRGALLTLALGLAFIARSVGYGLFWTANHAFDWITAGACAGLAIGLPLAIAALRLPERLARPTGAALLACAIVAVNVAPPDPVIFARPRPTRMMELEPLSAVTRTTALVWPFATIGFLLWPRRRRPTCT